MKIVTVVGARPQFVKAAAVTRAFTQHGIDEKLIHTGQHFDSNMSEIFFQEMDIPTPNYNLGIVESLHGAMTGKMLEKIEGILLKEKPDKVVVYGDTNSTLAGSLAATKLHIPLVHVEAGLRSYNRKMPEEMNRILTDHCSDILFTPTQTATDNLLKEGIARSKIHEVGDVMYDAAIYYSEKCKNSTFLEKHGLQSKNYALVTIHRAENVDDPAILKEIINGLILISNHCPVVLPLHPRTRKNLEKQGLLTEAMKHLILIEPVGYLDMITLETHAKAILTDSGGVQKEAYFFKVPCLILRNETEWTELLASGCNQLVPLTDHEILRTFLELDSNKLHWDVPVNGMACNKIALKLK